MKVSRFGLRAGVVGLTAVAVVALAGGGARRGPVPVSDREVAHLSGGDATTCYVRRTFSCDDYPGKDTAPCEVIKGYRIYLDEPYTDGYKVKEGGFPTYCHQLKDETKACSFIYEEDMLEKCAKTPTLIATAR